jgi:hypothetical protein
MKCSTCESDLDLSHPFCDTCGSPVPAAGTSSTADTMIPSQRPPFLAGAAPGAGIWSQPAVSGPPPEQLAVPGADGQGMAPPHQPGPPRLPGSPIRLGIDEVLWRYYHVLQMRGFAKGTGYLYVTDSRLIFFAYSTGFFLQRPSTLVQETKLEEVTGINTYVTRRVSLALLGAAILLGIIGLVCVFSVILILAAPIAWLLSVICFVALLTGHGNVGTTVIRVHSRHGVSPVHVGGAEGFGGAFGVMLGALFHPWRFIVGGNTAADVVVYGLPGQNAEEVVADLGALIQDLQTRGETAAPYWQVALPEPSRERGVALR